MNWPPVLHIHNQLMTSMTMMQLNARRIPVLLVLLMLSTRRSSAYVTSPHGLPVGRQLEWLKELTTDIVQAAPGQLSNSQLSASHDLIYAWSHTSVHNKECALQVETLLKRVIDEQVAGNPHAKLETDDYNCLMRGWARSGLGEASAVRTEEILQAMQAQGLTLDLVSFKACLEAWKQSGVPYAAVRAQHILEWMIQLAQNEPAKYPLPDADCFDVVLQLWGRTTTSRDDHIQAPTQTEHLLGVMQQLHDTHGSSANCKPRRTSFNAVLAAWSKSGSNQAADRAAAILSFMEHLSQSEPSVAPDSASYNTVMNAYARSCSSSSNGEVSVQTAMKSHALLQHVVDVAYQQQQENDGSVASLASTPPVPRHHQQEPLKPNTILFNTAMGIWAKTKKNGSYRMVRSILDRQVALSDSAAKPDVFGVTSVISSCAAETGHFTERTKAFYVALNTYQQMGKQLDVAPNHVTYGTMLKACAKLLPVRSSVRRKWARMVFEDAKEAGCVGDMVVAKLREAATPDVYRELMQGHTRKKLPSEWTANVNEASAYRTKNKRRKRAEV